MFEKAGKYYADWRDRQGNRKRKSFNSARAALTFEAEQKELAHPKKRAKGQTLPASYSPKQEGRKRTPSTKQPNSSSPSREVSRPANSAPRTLSKLTPISAANISRRPRGRTT